MGNIDALMDFEVCSRETTQLFESTSSCIFTVHWITEDFDEQQAIAVVV